jgi:hypothetical protein
MALGIVNYKGQEGSGDESRLGGVMVSVLATGPKFEGSNPVQTMDF